jgi:2-C-methyl-D-erythritol 2,4-cyclodiphosphate synthase
MFRIGFSEDIHPFKKGRKLFLGGIEIKGEEGLDGHSDADVVLHAVAEAILGAMTYGDLGTLFPDTDPKYKDISSVQLLEDVVEIMHKEGFKINNVDIQVATVHPHLSEYVLPMREKIAEILTTRPINVSIKAMTYNGIGPIGEGKACKAQAIVMLKHK